MERSAPKRTFLVFLSLVLGGITGIVLSFFGALFESAEKNEEEERKVEEIKESLFRVE